MARIDRRPNLPVYKGGSSLIDVGLVADDVTKVFGAGDPAWYVLAEIETSEFGESVEEEVVRNEADDIVTTFHNNETFDVQATLLNADTETLRLLDLLSEPGRFFKFRVPVPVGLDGDGNKIYQLWCLPHARVRRENWRIQNAASQNRTRQITIVGYPKDGEPPYLVADVELVDQSGWPAELDGFLDTVYAAA